MYYIHTPASGWLGNDVTIRVYATIVTRLIACADGINLLDEKVKSSMASNDGSLRAKRIDLFPVDDNYFVYFSILTKGKSGNLK